ncbi:MAG: FAD-binding protein [Chloroflexi bacterium]|nr:FAD-binding protein [Chloroflexota bacterium]
MRLLTDEGDRESYRRDETVHFEPGLPLAVALPSSTDEVAEIMRLATSHRVPVVPRGAGSGLSGGSAGVEGALTIVLTRMNAILEIDHGNLVAVVQPGVINADLKTAVAQEGLFYAPDPASYEFCTIGGNIGTNAGGLCCVKYGVTRDAILSLEVVLVDGRVIRTGGRNVKDVAGYSLTHLFVGSQGTLGIVTEATVRLRPAPPPKRTMLAFFPTLESAGRAVAAMTAAGLEPCTLELMDRTVIGAVDDWHALGLDRSAAALLLIESDRPGSAAGDELAAGEAACTDWGATSVVRATDPTEADWLRQVRRLAFRAMERFGVARMEDVGAPRSLLPELLSAIQRIAAAHEVRCGTFGHAGDGNLHPTFVWDRGDAEAEERVQAACEELYRAAIAMGGTVTGEHGIGAARRDFLELQRGADAVAVMRSIKTALDPLNILNPGKVL